MGGEAIYWNFFVVVVVGFGLFVVFTTIHCFFFLSEETFGLHIYSVEGGYLFYKE